MSIPKIKTFEGACKALKLDPVKALPKVSGMPKRHQDATIAHAKLVIIIEALNEGWKPDWKNGQWDKWYPWFWMNSGSGLSLDDVDDQFSFSYVGSRLCLKSRELAEYAAKKFKKLYEAYYLIK